MNRLIAIIRYGVVAGLLSVLIACQTSKKTAPPSPVKPSVTTSASPFKISQWTMLPAWEAETLRLSWPALQQSCRVLEKKDVWKAICREAAQLNGNDEKAMRLFYETSFTPYQLINLDGTEYGLITGYYEPLLRGSRQASAHFRYPLYGVPDDLLEIDLSDVYPQFKGMRLRGRLEGKKIIPYANRSQINSGLASLKGRELFWVENEIELFFLQIQGSGRIELEDGQRVKIGYADQNGHPYNSIGKKLIEMGELKPEEASMQGIKNWAENNPGKVATLLGQNPSYVFFRELPETLTSPLGALGVPLTEEYSIAVDPRTVPLGFPVFLATTQPNTNIQLNRLMYAQDTGGAIKGRVRADFFWGFGANAALKAGSMKQQGRMWVLFPRGIEPVLN